MALSTLCVTGLPASRSQPAKLVMQLFSAVRRRELECSLQFVLLGAQAVDILQSARLGTSTKHFAGFSF